MPENGHFPKKNFVFVKSTGLSVFPEEERDVFCLKKGSFSPKNVPSARPAHIIAYKMAQKIKILPEKLSIFQKIGFFKHKN